jgi:site-specific recombinase XerC
MTAQTPASGGPAASPWRRPVNAYVDELRSLGVGYDLRSQRRRYLIRLEEDCGDSDPWTVTAEQVVRSIDRPRASVVTRRNAASAIRFFYAWAIQRGYIEKSPADHIPGFGAQARPASRLI